MSDVCRRAAALVQPGGRLAGLQAWLPLRGWSAGFRNGAVPSPDARALSYVFIISYGRSGSTLLAQILNSIDGYRIRGENYNALHGLYKAHRALERARQKQGPKRIHAWDGASDIEVEEFTQTCVAAFVRNVLRPQPGDRVIGFKEIRYLHSPDQLPDFLNFILQFFKEVRFVINVRHPEDAARSGWWASTSGAPELISAYNKVLEDIAAADPHRFHLVRYESYATNPSALRPLFDWLGEPFSEDAAAQVVSAEIYS